eukprot:15439608-Alexandrium_andersonii.AAC.1
MKQRFEDFLDRATGKAARHTRRDAGRDPARKLVSAKAVPRTHTHTAAAMAKGRSRSTLGTSVSSFGMWGCLQALRS